MPWHDKVQTNPLVIKDGYFELPSTPGLGTDLDETIFADRPFEPDLERDPAGRSGSWNAEDNSVNDV